MAEQGLLGYCDRTRCQSIFWVGHLFTLGDEHSPNYATILHALWVNKAHAGVYMKITCANKKDALSHPFEFDWHYYISDHFSVVGILRFIGASMQLDTRY